MDLNVEAAAAYMAESGVCALLLPSERAACLANKCSCRTKTEELLRRAEAFEAARLYTWLKRLDDLAADSL